MRIRFIVNPKSGREASEGKISNIIKYLFEDGHEVSVRYTKKAHDATDFAIEATKDKVDRLVVSGGDGTANETVCGLLKCNSEIPLTIVPAGTTNDFANYMGLVKNEWDTYKMIVDGNIEKIDCGKVSDRYFLNVGAVGAFTDVAHNTSTELKTTFGRAAYVMKAVSEIKPENFMPMNLKIESEEVSGVYKSFVALITNSKSVGGFPKMAPLASVTDGYLDVIVFKEMPFTELLAVFLKVKAGEHVKHPNVMYFKTKKITISCDEDVELDVDGEYFGNLPATFEIVEKGINLCV
ncbi:MAG: diacylglycerol kinase family lipid kinase [Ezakiella sp.]|nr:diacylglycerol kinase family lipid kinase [Ezakiella sp.]MDD7471629.1 diacylglycerol kinase family lipid kinase [Bacillota bacterium]MDY3923413.1 diacylglycerol kinase family lipid kinase [Ezakiella sp.]